MADSSVINEIKERLSIVEVVQQRVPLTRTGRNYKGLCPFHGEKTPSFVVFGDSQSYHCFGCGQSGDIFSFVMGTEGIEFHDALERLARQAGVEIKPRDESEAIENRHRERLHELVASASMYFNNLLLRSSTENARLAREYATSRGLTDKTISTFQIGFAPDSWDAAGNYLRERGYSTAELLEVGLLVEREGEGAEKSYYDRFRNRLMFPIRDQKGKFTGFGARALDDHPPKYLNSPQTTLYDKSSTLYGIDLAWSAIRQSHTAIIVEGYMDVIIAHQSGHANVIGASGTALTEKQAGMLQKVAKRIILALDPDAAGDLAALRGSAVLEQSMDRISIPILGPRGLLSIERRLDAEILIMSLPQGKDPDELLLEDPGAWDRLVNDASPVADHFIRVVTAGLDLRTARGKSEAVTQLAPLIKSIGDPVQRAHYIQKVATLTQSPPALIERAVSKSAPIPADSRRRLEGPATEEAVAPAPEQRDLTPEEHLLALILRYPQVARFPEAPMPNLFSRTENRLITQELAHHVALADANVDPEAPAPYYGYDPAADLNIDEVRVALDPALQGHFDYVLEKAMLDQRVYPPGLPAELEKRSLRFQNYRDRNEVQQLELESLDLTNLADQDAIMLLTMQLEQLRSRLSTYVPARSTVFRDTRD